MIAAVVSVASCSPRTIIYSPTSTDTFLRKPTMRLPPLFLCFPDAPLSQHDILADVYRRLPPHPYAALYAVVAVALCTERTIIHSQTSAAALLHNSTTCFRQSLPWRLLCACRCRVVPPPALSFSCQNWKSKVDGERKGYRGPDTLTVWCPIATADASVRINTVFISY